MKRIKREEREAPERKGFSGRRLLEHLPESSAQKAASSVVLETIQAILGGLSLKEDYARILLTQSVVIAKGRGEARIPAAGRKRAVRPQTARPGIQELGYGQYKSTPGTGRHGATAGRHDTLPDMSLLDLPQSFLEERKVTFEGLAGAGRRKKFIYHGNGLNAPFDIPSEIKGGNLMTAIDLRISSIHKETGSPYVPEILEAQSQRQGHGGIPTGMPPVARRIASALERLVADESVATAMVPKEYRDAFHALRRLHNRTGKEPDGRRFAKAFSILDHPAFKTVKALPEGYFVGGKITDAGLEIMKEEIARADCALDGEALRNLAQAYALAGGENIALRWNIVTLRKKHFQMAAGIRKFIKEKCPGWTFD